MYIKKVEIKNIRSIEHFSMTFPKNAAGWHVLIGDNGSGKSTIIRAIAAAMVGHFDILALRVNWRSWLRDSERTGNFSTLLNFNRDFDYWPEDLDLPQRGNIEISFSLERENGKVNLNKADNYLDRQFYPWWYGSKGWFSSAFGPFRRFSGGSEEWDSIWKSYPKLAAHLSAFGENVALTECIEWLKDLNYKRLENRPEGDIVVNIKRFINEGGLLPHGAELVDIASDGVFFEDGNGNRISINELSDGYRSILSLTFELLRQMVIVYGEDLVFEKVNAGKPVIALPGVVLADEIDAHLHPTWQARIGQWFLKYFPKIQFIVTTHSPIICRAAKKGSIWRLSAPGSDEPSRKITGTERDRLVFGNVLEALGTEAFGSKVSRSQESTEKLERLAELNMLHSLGKISSKEKTEMENLRKIFTTDDQTEF